MFSYGALQKGIISLALGLEILESGKEGLDGYDYYSPTFIGSSCYFPFEALAGFLCEIIYEGALIRTS